MSLPKYINSNRQKTIKTFSPFFALMVSFLFFWNNIAHLRANRTLIGQIINFKHPFAIVSIADQLKSKERQITVTISQAEGFQRKFVAQRLLRPYTAMMASR